MVQQGKLILNLESADGHLLDFSKDDRDKTLEFVVAFPTPFARAPMVHLSVVGISSVAQGKTNWRPDLWFDLSAAEISQTSFKIDVIVGWPNCAKSITCAWLALDL